MNQDDEILIDRLHRTLGDAYHEIITEFLRTYRFISVEPVRVRIRAEVSDANIYEIGIDPNGARFFYLYSALTSQRDAFGKSLTSTIKYNAHVAMLEHYRCAAQAYQNGWLNLVSYFPSELDKMCHKLTHLFKVEHSHPPSPKAAAVTIVSAGFDPTKMLAGQAPVIDPFEFSDDDVPRVLPKPVANVPPHVQVVRQYVQEQEESRPWNLIPDE